MPGKKLSKCELFAFPRNEFEKYKLGKIQPRCPFKWRIIKIYWWVVSELAWGIHPSINARFPAICCEGHRPDKIHLTPPSLISNIGMGLSQDPNMPIWIYEPRFTRPVKVSRMFNTL